MIKAMFKRDMSENNIQFGRFLKALPILQEMETTYMTVDFESLNYLKENQYQNKHQQSLCQKKLTREFFICVTAVFIAICALLTQVC